jgi:hypothetical protein
MNQLAPIPATYAPALVAASGPRASYRFLTPPLRISDLPRWPYLWYMYYK